MRTIVIYYSLTGTTQRVAERIANAMHADLLRIEVVKEPASSGVLRLPMMAIKTLFEYKNRLKNELPDLSLYDHVFIGGPIWFRRIPGPLRSFITQVNIHEKIVIPFCTYDDSMGCYFEDLRRACPMVRFYFGMGFKLTKDDSQDELDEQIRLWVNNIKSA